MEIAAILHNIRSTHNVGSIFRTADGMGLENIYLTGITPSPLDRFGELRKDFTKVSLGAEKYISWEKVKSVNALIKRLKGRGYKVIAVEQHRKSVLYYKAKVKKQDKIALVFGNEVKGIPPSILKMADKIIEIPMLGKKESLNVAVAFGVVAYHFSFGYNK